MAKVNPKKLQTIVNNKKGAGKGKPASTPPPASKGAPKKGPKTNPINTKITDNPVSIDSQKGFMGRVGAVAKTGWDNSMDFHGGGKEFAIATAKSAAVGAVGGGAIGGSMEWAQGGSFWTGAKEGAFNGAVGWAGYRTMKNAYGDGKGWNSTMRGVKTHYDATGDLGKIKNEATRGKVSKQVTSLLQTQQGANLAKNVNGLK